MLLLLGQQKFRLLAQPTLHRVAGSPYPYSSVPGRLYLTSENYSYSEKISLQTLMGIIAKTKPEILRDIYGHRQIVEKAGIPFSDEFYTNYPGLLAHFKDRLTGYILCNARDTSTNVAISLSGILNAVAIPADIEQVAISAGLTKVLDVRDKNIPWLLANYGNKFSKTIASYQQSSDDRGVFLADYSSFAGALQFWDPSPKGSIATSVYNRMNSGATFFGWGPSEDGTVEELSKRSQMIHPADWAPNLSALTNIPAPEVRQKAPLTPFKVVPGVHTVCFVITDGDNVQWLLGAHNDQNLWASPNKTRLNLGWTISPALVELAPAVYQKYVENMPATPEGRNYLIAAPSGRGYYNPGIFPDLNAETELLTRFMKKADLRIVNVIDVDNSPRNLEPYLKHSNIDALFYYNYSNYSGLNGQITWYKDKPAIGGRYTLYGKGALPTDQSPESLAAILNRSSTNITTSEGYSLIPVNTWRMNVNSVLECIKKLGPTVRVVAPDEFVWLVRKNIKKVNLGSGNGLKGEYFKGSGFEQLKFMQTDKSIDFDWQKGSPNNELLGNDQFSVRWSGQIQPVYSEPYTFYVNASSGVKLMVNGQAIINELPSQKAGVRTAKKTLVAGQKYTIKLEYSEKGGDAYCILEWESPSQLRQTVPGIQFYSTPTTATTGVITTYPDCNYEGTPVGLQVGDYTREQLSYLGITDNDISSLKIAEGFKALVYDGDNFTGTYTTLTADNSCLTANRWNNKITSIKIRPNGTLGLSGTFHLQNKVSGLYMDVVGGLAGTSDGVNIQQWNPAKTMNQTFQLVHVGDGAYRLTAVHSDKSVDVEGSSTSEGANVRQWTYYGSPNQQFIILPATDGHYKLIAKHSGKVVDVENGSTAPEANVLQTTNTNQASAQWKFVPATITGGNGLNADYYKGLNFESLTLTRVDPTINFNWGDDSPDGVIGVDGYSVRWTGQIEPRYSETYTFHITSDNGRRLWIDDSLVIDKWINDWDIEYTGTIALTAGKKHNIRLEYFEDFGGANITFEWSSPSQAREVVPKSQLYSTQTNQGWQMKQGKLMTDFAAQIDPIHTLPEYPRPQLQRKDWLNLNGVWQYKNGGSNEIAPPSGVYTQSILVPFPVESAISGIMSLNERMWYKREFTVPAGWKNKRIILNFGAVEWEAEVFINEVSVGTHRGGFDPFSFDITDYIVGTGPQTITVRVYDPNDGTPGVLNPQGGNAYQPTGKQTLAPSEIFYTSASGIWQTVWLEPVNEVSIKEIKMVPDIDANVLKLTVNLNGTGNGIIVSAKAKNGNTVAGSITGAAETELIIPIADLHLWSPVDPFLYDLDIVVTKGSIKFDSVRSYFGMRKIALGKEDGYQKIFLNNKALFLKGPLDQGYWPDGIYTAPTDEALKFDLEKIKELGFNMVRKHIKVEHARWYYWADKLGLVVFQDMVCLEPSGAITEVAKDIYKDEMTRMIKTHYNYPSIGMWIVFNESWGQFDTEAVTQLAMSLDPTRLVNCASGWNHFPVGDINDTHSYPNPNAKTDSTQAVTCGEYGGVGFRSDGHTWLPDRDVAYIFAKNQEDLNYEFKKYQLYINDFTKSRGICSSVYTQITDVEREINGFYTYDRKVLKFDQAGVVAANALTDAKLTYRTVAATGQNWQFTTTAPSETWFQEGFDDTGWASGKAPFGTLQPFNTNWNTPDVWMRRTFNPGVLSAEDVRNLVFKLFHDDEAEIYINGVFAGKAYSYVEEYMHVPFYDAALTAIRPDADNVIAVHCHQFGGLQKIDVGLDLMIPGPVTGNDISITSPVPNQSYHTGGVVPIQARVTGGSISKVDFYNGNSLIGTDLTAPYSFTWTNVASGTYFITAKATSRSGTTTTSAVVAITVSNNPCASIPQYVENGGYIAGSIVVNAGKQYRSKPYPFSEWCNGPALAYAPGTGTSWQQAWTLIGTCGDSHRVGYTHEEAVISPNPATEFIRIPQTQASSIIIYNVQGVPVLKNGKVRGDGTLSIRHLPAGVYTVEIVAGSGVVRQTIIKQ